MHSHQGANVYKAYSLNDEYKFTALEHNKYELLKLYEYLQVLRWKIRTKKDNKKVDIIWWNMIKGFELKIKANKKKAKSKNCETSWIKDKDKNFFFATSI